MSKKIVKKGIVFIVELVIILFICFKVTAVEVTDVESKIDFKYGENGEYCYNIQSLEELLND